jgi:hypothetical protein
MMMLGSETITTLKRKISGLKRNNRGMFKAQVTNNGTDRLGELVLESVTVAPTKKYKKLRKKNKIRTPPPLAPGGNF